jgi:hypothetical protein
LLDSDTQVAEYVVQGVIATGGSVTDTAGFRTHTFLASGSFVVTNPGTIEYLVVAGGGSGGGNSSTGTSQTMVSSNGSMRSSSRCSSGTRRTSRCARRSFARPSPRVAAPAPTSRTATAGRSRSRPRTLDEQRLDLGP